MKRAATIYCCSSLILKWVQLGTIQRPPDDESSEYPVKLRLFTNHPRKQKLYATKFQLTKTEYNAIWLTKNSHFSPISLYFEVTKQGRLILNGGMIFHGSHDRGGNGSAPTFSVNLTPTTGWAIHT